VLSEGELKRWCCKHCKTSSNNYRS